MAYFEGRFCSFFEDHLPADRILDEDQQMKGSTDVAPSLIDIPQTVKRFSDQCLDGRLMSGLPSS